MKKLTFKRQNKESKEDKFLKVMFLAMVLVCVYIWLLAPQRVEGATLDNLKQIGAFKLDSVASSDSYSVDTCDLSFYSYKELKVVQTPKRFFNSLTRSYNCEELKVLTRLAHYESQWGLLTQNPDNEYAKGEFMILPTTRIGECLNKYGITEEDQCASFVMSKFPSWYLAGYKAQGDNWDKSFYSLN